MFRKLIPILNQKYRVIAPDLPGFGFSEAKSHDQFAYTFDNMAKTMQSFIDQLDLKHFALYVFDYGAPTGFRLAMANPEKITAIISQNGNAYTEGLSTGWNPIRTYWENPTKDNRDSLNNLVSKEAIWYQYNEGASNPSLIAPESYTMDQYFLDRPGNIDIQLDYYWIIKQILRFIQNSRNISGNTPRHFWPYGEIKPLTFFLPVLRLISATFQRQ